MSFKIIYRALREDKIYGFYVNQIPEKYKFSWVSCKKLNISAISSQILKIFVKKIEKAKKINIKNHSKILF